MDYVHGYSAMEHTRLADQASTLTELLHADTHYPAGSHVLEAGCGVGAQTVILAVNSPDAEFTCVDVSAESLAVAQRAVRHAGHPNVTFRRADIFDLPHPPDHFDHVFVCFVLTCIARQGRTGRSATRSSRLSDCASRFRAQCTLCRAHAAVSALSPSR